MNVTLAGIEELDLFPSVEARDAAIEEHARSIRGWSLIVGIAIAVSAAATSFILARWAIVPFIAGLLPFVLPPYAHEIMRFAIIIMMMFFTIRGLHRWGVRRELRMKLLTLKIPVCLGCGYLLRGLPHTTEQCPECGRGVDDTVRAIWCDMQTGRDPLPAERS